MKRRVDNGTDGHGQASAMFTTGGFIGGAMRVIHGTPVRGAADPLMTVAWQIC